MIAMGLPSFLSLLVIGAVCAFFLHWMANLQVMPSGEGYLCEWIAGWIGAWIGSPVVGHWGMMVPETSVYLVPAIIGSAATIFMLVAMVRVLGSVMVPLSSHENPPFTNETHRVA